MMDSPGMTAIDAARTIEETRRWDSVLRHRTEGLTWMLWGIVTGGMFFSYTFAGMAHAPEWTFPVLWIPWVVIGNVFVVLLWKTASFSNRRVAPERSWRKYVGMILAFIAIFTLEFLVFRIDSWLIPMYFAAIAWGGMGLFMPSMSPRGKRASMGIGVVTLLCALILSVARPAEPLGGVLASLCLFVAAFGGGLIEATLG